MTNNMIERLVERAGSESWYLKEEALNALFIRAKSFGLPENAKETNVYNRSVTANKEGRYEYDIVNGFAIIDVNGETQKATDIYDELFGVRSTEKILSTLNHALSNSAVNAVVFSIDSPGGTVDGTKELSDAIFEARGKKPLISYTNGLMTSAAYYYGSAADMVMAAPGANIGSIGVYSVHMDASKFYESFGLKMSVIKAGKYKAIGNQFEELSPEARSVLQERVDKMYETFVSDIARNRGVDVEVVKKDMAEAKVFFASDALSNGLIDAIGYLDKQTGTFKVSENKSKKGVQMEIFGTSLEKASVEQLKEKNQVVYNQIFEAGKEAGKAENTEQGKEALEAKAVEAGNKAKADEKARVKSIFEAASADQIQLASTLVLSEKSLEEAKTELLKDAQAVKAKALADFQAGASSTIDHTQEAATNDVAALASKFDTDTKLSDLYTDKGGKDAFIASLNKWSADEKVRADFGGNVQSFLAFERNNNK